jgi:hypothetical protein
MSMKNSSDSIGNRTRDLPVCSAEPQPTAPPRAPSAFSISKESQVTFPVQEHTTVNTPPSSLHVRKLSATRSQSVYVSTAAHGIITEDCNINPLRAIHRYRQSAMQQGRFNSKVQYYQPSLYQSSPWKYSTMSKFLWYTSRQLYFEQNSSDIPAEYSTLSKIPLIYQQTALLWAKFLWYTSRQIYFEQNSSDIPADSSTLSKIPLINQQTALLWAQFLWHTSRQFYFEQNSSAKPADSSTLSKIPLIYQQTDVLWAKFLWYTSRQLYYEQKASYTSRQLCYKHNTCTQIYQQKPCNKFWI